MKAFIVFLLISLCSSTVVVGQQSNGEDQSNVPKKEQILMPGDQPHFPAYNDHPGGLYSLKKYVEDHLVFPAEAKANGEEGRVVVNFVVEKDGSLSNIRIQNGVSPALDSAAVNLVRGMPNWIPARKKKKAQRMGYFLPLKFSL